MCEECELQGIRLNSEELQHRELGVSTSGKRGLQIRFNAQRSTPKIKKLSMELGPPRARKTLSRAHIGYPHCRALEHHNSSNQRIYGIDLIQILDSQPPGLGHAHTHSLGLSVDIWHASLCSPTLRVRDSVCTLDQAAVHVRFHTSRRIPSARNCNQRRSVTWPSWRCSWTMASNEAETGTCAMNTPRGRNNPV
jgi:hypothetical protein